MPLQVQNVLMPAEVASSTRDCRVARMLMGELITSSSALCRFSIALSLPPVTGCGRHCATLFHGASGVRRRADTGKCTSPFFSCTRSFQYVLRTFPGSGFLVAYRRRDVSRAQQRVCDGQHLSTGLIICVMALFEYPTAVEIVSTDIGNTRHSPQF